MSYHHISFFLFLSILFFPIPVFTATIDLSVPFTSQAPEQNWSQPWQDACEETSITMIDSFYGGHTTLSIEEAKKQIMRTYTIKTNDFGYSLDENSETITEIINRYFPWEAKVVERPSISMMEAELDAGRPIIIPAHGTELNNPHFLSPLLDYHVIVLKGYDSDTREFISNDPGTQYGASLRYSYETIEEAMHDFEPGNMPYAKKVAIFTSPTITSASALLDADNDNLPKVIEILYGSVLYLADSDGDGYSDGLEAHIGYSPISASPIRTGSLLVKSPNNPKVYRIYLGAKRHIASAEAFHKRGYTWSMVRTIPTALLETIPLGAQLK